MKKIYFVMLALLFTTGAFAQIKSEQPIPRTPNSMPARAYHDAAARSEQQIWLEYDSADSYINAPVSNSHYIWDFNQRYTSIDSSHSSPTVAFDSLYDLYLNYAIPKSTVASLRVDSFYVAMGHQNLSGTNDTIIARIVALDANGLPTNTTLWSDTTITDVSMSSNGNWLNAFYNFWYPSFDIPAGGKHFGIEIDYYGDKADTFGIIAGFNGASGTGVCTGAIIAGDYSNFYPNSFETWTQYGLYLPDPNQGDIFYDCDQDGNLTLGIDGVSYMQDIIIGAYVTVTDNVGLQDLKKMGFGLSQNIPNPVNKTTKIGYDIVDHSKEVTLFVNDLLGNQVMVVNEGSKNTGGHVIDLDVSSLAKGVYTYTLRANDAQLTKKMIVE